MILGDVEETVTTIVIDEETYEEIYKVRKHAEKYICIKHTKTYLTNHAMVCIRDNSKHRGTDTFTDTDRVRIEEGDGGDFPPPTGFGLFPPVVCFKTSLVGCFLSHSVVVSGIVSPVEYPPTG